MPAAGSSDLIFLALRAWLTPRSRVLLLDPTYGEYVHVCEQVIGARVERFTLRRQERYAVDLDRLEARCGEGYDLVILVNPNNPLVKAVLTTMVESGDYFFFVLDPPGGVTVFRSEIGQEDLAGLKTHLPRIRRSATTEAQYRKAVAVFEQAPEPPGVLAPWVCRDARDYLDLTGDRLELTPV